MKKNNLHLECQKLKSIYKNKVEKDINKEIKEKY